MAGDILGQPSVACLHGHIPVDHIQTKELQASRKTNSDRKSCVVTAFLVIDSAPKGWIKQSSTVIVIIGLMRPSISRCVSAGDYAQRKCGGSI